MLSIGLIIAILASLSWGGADFSGGVATRRHHQFQVIALGSAAALLPLVGIALWQGEGLPDLRSALLAVFAGAAGSMGLTVFYLGLARSSMAVVAPTASVVGTILPVAFSFFTQGLPGNQQLMGFGVALLGIWLSAQTPKEAAVHVRQGLVWAGLAGVGFGVFLTVMAQVSPDAVFGSITLSKFTAVLVMLGLLRQRGLMVPKPVENPVALLSGLLDAGGNVFYLLSTQLIRMDVAVVFSSMGPVWTVVLARIFLKEQVAVVQWAGVILCVAAIALISS